MMRWFAATLVCLALPAEGEETVGLNPLLQTYIEARSREFGEIPAERRERLGEIGKYVRGRLRAKGAARLTFLCTHNSRRSHMAQIWAQAAATFYGVSGVTTFSGGTEATAFNPRAVNALKRAGFEIAVTAGGDQDNPRYRVGLGAAGRGLECFSKVYDQDPNPRTDYCAVMTCSQADAACPLVPGAALRIAIPYDDPKSFDGTPEEEERYDERCRQIAREMLFIFAEG